MASCTMGAFKGRDVATVDIPGAFLHAKLDEKVLMRIGAMDDLLVKIYQEKYEPFLEEEAGKYVLYVQLKNDFYGTTKASLLF